MPLEPHTPEPWRYDSGAVWSANDDPEHPQAVAIAVRGVQRNPNIADSLAPCTKDANMRRIAACVNACAGVSDDKLAALPAALARMRALDTDDAFAASVGLILARMLGMPMIAAGPEKGRYRTAIGTKTPAGLARTVARLIATGEPQP